MEEEHTENDTKNNNKQIIIISWRLIMIIIKETTIEDVKNVQRLWADGDVMRFVGFPDG